jgi:hypothetical protein
MLFTLLFALNFIYADDATCSTTTNSSKIKNAVCAVYDVVNDVLPVLAFVLMILAGAVYAAGQFFGAEMRAKAVGWAMNMVTGAIIGLILNAVLPSILSYLYNGTSNSISSTTLCVGVKCT